FSSKDALYGSRYFRRPSLGGQGGGFGDERLDGRAVGAVGQALRGVLDVGGGDLPQIVRLLADEARVAAGEGQLGEAVRARRRRPASAAPPSRARDPPAGACSAPRPCAVWAPPPAAICPTPPTPRRAPARARSRPR